MELKIINIMKKDVEKFKKEEIILRVLCTNLRNNMRKLKGKLNNNAKKSLDQLFYKWVSLESINAADPKTKFFNLKDKFFKYNKDLRTSTEEFLLILEQIENNTK